jgi:CHASE2 domain-containing sensor protein
LNWRRFNSLELTTPNPKEPFWINWPGPTSQLTQYSFIEVIHNKVPIQKFHNKIVLIGYTATGIDQLLTPFDGANGVYFHAAVINSLLQQNALHRISGFWFLFILLLAGPGLSLVLFRLTTEQQLVVWIGVCCSWGLLSFFLFKVDYWLPTAAPIATLFLAGMVIQLVELDAKRLERQTNQDLMSLFNEHLKPEVVSLILQPELEDPQDENHH